MTDEQKAAYVHAQAISAEIELAAMMAANFERDRRGEAPAYSEEAFMELQTRYCIGHNETYALFHDLPK